MHVRYLPLVLCASLAHATLEWQVDMAAEAVHRFDGGEAILHQGTALAAGDLTGDGIPDLLVGTRGDTRPLSMRLLPGPLGASGPTTQINASTFDSGGTPDTGFLRIADVSGDGVNDLIVTQPTEIPSRVRILFGPLLPGTLSLEAATDVLVLPGPTNEFTALTGWDLDVADIDGDGRPDLVLGEPYNRGESAAGTGGAVHVLCGPLSPGTRDLAAGSADITILGDGHMSFGHSVAAADLSGDGVTDLAVVSLRRDATSARDAGAVHVLRGPIARGTRLISTDPADSRLFGEWPTPVTDDGGDAHAWLATGDLTGDGRPDLAIGRYLTGGVLGRPAAGQVDVVASPIVNGSRLVTDSFVHARFLGREGEHLGFVVDVTDVDGDGAPDLMAGAYGAPGPCGTGRPGAAHVLRGPLAPGVQDFAVQGPDVSFHGDADGQECGIPAVVMPEGLAVACVRADVGGVDEAGSVHVVPWPSSGASLTAPCCDPGGPYAVSCSGALDPCGGLPQLDGTGSFDPGGGSLEYFWVIQCGSFAHVSRERNPRACAQPLATRPCLVSLTVTNSRGESSTCTTEITLDGADAAPPVLTDVAPDVTVSCDAVAPSSPPNATDDCGAPTVAFSETRTDGACPHSYRLDRTWTATDLAGNSASATQVVTVVDAVPPRLAAVEPLRLAECDAVPAPAPPDAVDDCDPAPVVTASESREDGPCAHSYNLLRSWIATDACGNSTEAEQTIVVRDTVAPSLSGVPSDAAVPCDALPAAPAVGASDACDPAPAVAFAESREDGPCTGTYRLIRSWTATDACGNATSQAQSIQVSDVVAPVLRGVPADASASCDAVPAPAAVTAEDACDPAATFTFAESREDGPCPGRYRLRRSWTGRDDCGNESAATQALDVRDDVAPVVVASEAVIARLWPPSHRPRCFGLADVAPSVTEACSEPVVLRFAGCESDQADDGTGDGSTDGDCVVSADGMTACVRSERAGGAPEGRTYRLLVSATDACGNASDATVVGVVVVPHDQRRR